MPFSSSDHNDLTEAFALAEGAFVAIDQVQTLMSRYVVRSMDRFEIRFWSDSQVVLRALKDSRRLQTHHKKMQHVLHIIELKVLELQKLHSDVSVQFRWCPGECVEPHALADELSKRVRMFGGNTLSMARSLFEGLPHDTIQAAIRQQAGVPYSLLPVGRSSHMPVARSTTAKAAVTMTELATSPRPNDSTTRRSFFSHNDEPQHITCDSLQSHPLQVSTAPTIPSLVTPDTATTDVSHEAAESSRLFSIITCAVDSLAPSQRPRMYEAVRQQQDSNGYMRVSGQAGLNPTGTRDGDVEPPSSGLPNSFSLIEAAAVDLPDFEKKMILAAIDLQMKANSCRAQNEGQNHVYESGSSEVDGVNNEHTPLEESKALNEGKTIEGPMDLDKSVVLEEPKSPVEPEVINGSTNLEQHEILDELKFVEQPEVHEEPQAVGEPEVFGEPETPEAPRLSRVRVVWNWVGRRFRRL